MAIIGSFIKQPADRLDYEVRYDAFLSTDDEVVSAIATVEPATDLTVMPPLVTRNNTAVKLWFEGGTDGTTYKVTLTTTTLLGRIKQDEIRMRIRDY